MTPAAADTALFGDTLSCTLTLPVRLRAAAPPPGAAAAAAAERLLHGVALVEDSHPEEKAHDERGPQELALQRMEAKLDLLLGLMGRLLAGAHEGAAAVPLRWSYRGLCLPLPAPWAEGAAGLLTLPLAPWLPQSLELPVRVLATEPVDTGVQKVWLAVEPLTEALAEALKRHLFRLHRRAIAEEKRAH